VAVVSAAAIPFERLVQAFNDAYSGYPLPVHVDNLELRRHIEQHDINLDISLIAMQDDLIAGVGLLAVRSRRGWIGGLGVHPDYRQQGIGRQLMQALIEQSRTLGLATIQLEVLEKNTPAHQLYQTLGFTDVRRLHVLDYTPTSAPASETAIETYDPSRAILLHQAFHKIPTPWQRSHRSLKRSDASIQAWIIPGPTPPLAYALGYVFSDTIHLLDLSCVPGHKFALTTLIDQLHRQFPEAKGRIVNVAENEPGCEVLMALGWKTALMQHEMILTL
jgi:ribosomal protein S18 acetylase RimI-like enzyme